MKVKFEGTIETDSEDEQDAIEWLKDCFSNEAKDSIEWWLKE